MVAYFGVKYGVTHYTSINNDVPAEIANNPAYQKLIGEIGNVEDELNSAKTVDKQLQIVEKAFSKKLPLKVDEITTMTRVKAGPGKRFTYEYVLDGPSVAKLSAKDIEKAMRPHLEAQYKSKAMQSFRDDKIFAYYRYLNPKGKLIVEIVISPNN